jgi:GNAT superfamily N-acetyltransferase
MEKLFSDIHIRPCIDTDMADIAFISEELGYPSTSEQVARRFNALKDRPSEHAIFVAQKTDGGIVGWVHVYGVRLLESDGYAEIGGLVVLSQYRKNGIGRALMIEAEKWAKEFSYSNVRLRSGMQRRDEAHLFYEKIGYLPSKQSMMFRKDIPL